SGSRFDEAIRRLASAPCVNSGPESAATARIQCLSDVMRIVDCFAVAVVLLAVLSNPSAAQTAADPLRLGFECQHGAEDTFRFTIQNLDRDATTLVIGSILGNDQKYIPGRLILEVRHPGEPEVSLTYVDSTVPGVAGRIDPWVIGLPANATY